MTIELNPRQERMLHEAMQQRRFRSVDEALDEALRSIAPSAGDTGLQPARRTPAEAVARIRELRQGNILPEGVTIRSLIDDGRA
jgi:Arc/MetJ-type ribon-helix-helix transcriptional regulator